MPSHYGHSKQRQGKAKAKAKAAPKRSNLGGRIASGIHEVSPKRTRGKVYKPLGYGEGFGGAGAKSQQNPRLDMPRATPDIDRQRQRKRELGRQMTPSFDRTEPNPGMSRRIADSIQDKLRRRHDEDIIRPEMIPNWEYRRNLPNPGPDSPLGQQSGLQEPFLEERLQRVKGMAPLTSGTRRVLNLNGKKNGKKK